MILVLKQWLPKVPAVLVAVLVGIAGSLAFSLADKGVKVVGTLPQGIPAPSIPLVPLSDLVLLFLGALGISLVALTDTISNATSFAERRGRRSTAIGR